MRRREDRHQDRLKENKTHAQGWLGRCTDRTVIGPVTNCSAVIPFLGKHTCLQYCDQYEWWRETNVDLYCTLVLIIVSWLFVKSFVVLRESASSEPKMISATIKRIPSKLDQQYIWQLRQKLAWHPSIGTSFRPQLRWEARSQLWTRSLCSLGPHCLLGLSATLGHSLLGAAPPDPCPKSQFLQIN